MATTVQLHEGNPIKVAILAMGGQGGGVLADWIVDLAEHNKWWGQTTSVPGVAQRTGATIYYVEMLPESAVQQAGRQPALALMPTPGDVDLVVAAELMEGGRAIQRGLVTPDRSVLISSSHRSYAVGEKSARGNGISDPNKVIEAGIAAARRFYCTDLQALADKAGSVISASLFGAIAASGVLPFSREDFEDTIRRGGKGVEPSLRAFALGYDAIVNAPEVPPLIDISRPEAPVAQKARHPKVQRLLDEMHQHFPTEAHSLMSAGLRRTLEFQDLGYARQYLDHMRILRDLDEKHGGPAKSWALTTAAARYVAVAMAYDDVIRVADLKTRGSRFERVRQEVGVKDNQLLYTTEYMHPQVAEIAGTMPASLGRWILNHKTLRPVIERFCQKGRFLQSGTLSGFLMLYSLSGMRRFRRSTLRHEAEAQVLDEWLELICQTAPVDYDLAVEIVNCRRLIKGYSDTHERGTSKYHRLLDAARQLRGQADAASRLKALREAALADDHGEKLNTMIGQELKMAA